MVFSLKSRIWLTVFSIVVMFTFFTLFYFPAQQHKLLIKNYNTEVQNLANTVALGVKIALTEENFDGLDSAMKFVKDDPRLKFVSVEEHDTLWSDDHLKYQIKDTIFRTFPENIHPVATIQSNSSIIVKRGSFSTPTMVGEILLAFTTKEINESQEKIRNASLIVSGIVLLIGILLGLLLARKVSIPVMALRDAANRVGDGDLTQRVKITSTDEIGELGKAFNKMVDDLSKTRKQLHENNQTLSRTNTTLNNTLLELKSTQGQLIQSEKMASLGELTAGIAHEIQNPLNFVNNFAEVNMELIEEMKHEIDKGNFQELKLISVDISKNSEKIMHHGQRADAIVKGMLQHSRKSTGQKEPTDINALAHEYLRLSYHGLRAKDNSFNANLKTDFEDNIGKINIIPQDIGRVLVNLYNNAFYAVNEKSKTEEGFQPAVSVQTKKEESHVIISVSDNGNGIPHKVVDKIFQPFFTTKPTAQGTGLGLSLSYDIVKAHGGEIKVDTTEGEGTTFKIQLPIV